MASSLRKILAEAVYRRFLWMNPPMREATKAVAEWFPSRESGWAVALFDSGSSVGAALAPFIVLGVYPQLLFKVTDPAVTHLLSVFGGK